MAYELPEGFEFTQTVEPEYLYELLDKVAANNDTAGLAMPPDYVPEAFPSNDIGRIMLGVNSAEDHLVGYAGATIDYGQSYASIDCVIVDSLEADQGIGTALAFQTLGLLDGLGIKLVTFQPFGDFHKLAPRLVLEGGFTYVVDDREYIRHRDHFRSETHSIESELAALAAKQSPSAITISETPKQEASPADKQQLCAELAKLVGRCAAQYWDHATQPDSVSLCFTNAGREITIYYMLNGNVHCEIIEEGASDLVLSDLGHIIRTDARYDLSHPPMHPAAADVGYGEKFEILGKDDKLRPFIPPNHKWGGISDEYGVDVSEGSVTFPQDRAKHITAVIRRLSPEHLTDYDFQDITSDRIKSTFITDQPDRYRTSSWPADG